MQDDGNNRLALALIQQRLLQLIDKPNLAFSFLREDGAFVVPLKHVPGLYKERFGIAITPKDFGYLSVCELVQVGLSSSDVVVMDLPSHRNPGSTKQYMGRRNTQSLVQTKTTLIKGKASKKKKKVRFADENDDGQARYNLCAEESRKCTEKAPMDQQSPLSVSFKQNKKRCICDTKSVAMIPPTKPAMKARLPSIAAPKADLCNSYRYKQPPIVSSEIPDFTSTRVPKPDALSDSSDIELVEYFSTTSPMHSVVERRTSALGVPGLARNSRMKKINTCSLRVGRTVLQKPEVRLLIAPPKRKRVTNTVDDLTLEKHSKRQRLSMTAMAPRSKLTSDVATTILPRLFMTEDDSDEIIELMESGSSTLCGAPAMNNDFAALLALLPSAFTVQLSNPVVQKQLSEIIFDYGRKAMAWVNGHRMFLGEKDRLVSRNDIENIASKLSITDDKSRACLDGQLHRITPAQNAKGEIIGFSIRIGHHTTGCADIIDDLLHGTSAKSVLLLGGPGSGKTTMLRDIARSIASKSSVIVVDTTNDIGGDGDTPHASIGLARRVMIPSLKEQSKIALKYLRSTASIVVDKSFRHASDLEVAQVCAKQGVQLVTSAACANLRSSIECHKMRQVFGVTGFGKPLSITEDSTAGSTADPIIARRVSAPLFDCVLEATGNLNEWRLVPDTASAIDQILKGEEYVTQIRTRDPEK